jgi:citrate synthase
MSDTQKVAIPETANKGLEGIVACTSEISTIADVTLLYCGYTIEDLAAHCGFEEIAYLLWQGDLPSQAQLDTFKQTLYKNMTIPAELMPVIESVAKTNAHSMAKLRTVVSYYGQLDPKAEDITVEGVREKATRLSAALGPIVAAISRCEQGQKPLAANTSKTLAWNFLNMVRGKEPTAEEEKLFDTALVLHADHELNASTFACRAISSTNSDYYSAIVAGLASLKGPLHGGANEQVMIMLKEIGSYANIDAFIDDAVNAKKKVMGIGHRVYKHGDPRAKLLKELSLKTCQKAGLEDYHRMLVRIQEQMEEKKSLMPNVDFYSGLVYTALGLRSRDFTPIFAVSRITGWSAQLLEQYANNRIYRPRAFYTGKTGRHVAPIDKR